MTARPLTLFRQLTNGVYVIGVGHEGQSDAFTAAWVTQVSFDPLLLVLSINPRHASYPLLHVGRHFTVNILPQARIDLAEHFGTASGRDVDKLQGQAWRPSDQGCPILTDALAVLECGVLEEHPAGDHVLVIALVTAGEQLASGAEPLAYRATGNLDGSAELYPDLFP